MAAAYHVGGRQSTSASHVAQTTRYRCAMSLTEQLRSAIDDPDADSFQLMTETNNMRVLAILANASATIAEGEVLQLTAAQNLATDEGIYLQVVRGKTAALSSAATQVAPPIGNPVCPKAAITKVRSSISTSPSPSVSAT